MKQLSKLACAALLAAFCAGANAAIITYNVSWSGVPNGNTETATAVMTLDTAKFSQYGSSFDSLIAIDMVTSAAPGVHLTRSDFWDMTWQGGVGMNLNAELVGQATEAPYGGGGFGSGLWGTTGWGAFFLIGSTMDYSGSEYTLTDTSTWNNMDVVSMAPVGAGAVPEPATLALLGIAGLGFLRRRLPV